MTGTGDRRPLVIGLTGNIACGKSLVLAELARLGAETIDADRVAHGVMQPGQPAYDQIVAHFGPTVLAPGGAIHRRALGAIVFHDPAELAILDAIAHPATVAAIREQVARSTAPVVVIDAIKLIEVGLDADCDEVWVVTCDREQQIARLMARNGFSRDEAATRVDAQPPPEAKVARADRVIDNSGSVADALAQVHAAWEQLRATRRP